MTGLIGKRSCKKENEDILRKKLESIMYKTKKLEKKSQESVIKTCHKKKRARLRSIREKSIKNWFSVKKKRSKINNFLLFP